MLLSSWGFSQADINNGVVRLGVKQDGSLVITPINVPLNSASGSTRLGLRFMATNNDGVGVNPILQEGWGIADTISATWGGVQAASQTALSSITLTSTPSTAISAVTASGNLRVTHDYSPSANPNAYLVRVTVHNISASSTNVQYRRILNWDAEPTPMNAYLTIQGSTLPGVLSFTDSDFSGPNPLVAPGGVSGDIANVAPGIGSTWTISLGVLAPGATASFNMFFGAAADRSSALAVLSAVGAAGYSLNQPTASPPASGTPNTFFFGFNLSAVGPPPIIPTPGGINEGNYPGSKGLANGTGGEGTFGFGRQMRTLQPFLKGPQHDPNGIRRVFNVSHRQSQPTLEAEIGLGGFGWGLISLAIVAPATLVFARRR